jgi:hypothetical protein
MAQHHSFLNIFRVFRQNLIFGLVFDLVFNFALQQTTHLAGQ